MPASSRRSSRSPRPADVPARERLLRVAGTLFTTRGYAATSVREIVEGAGVTKPLLYHHFGSKEGIFLALIRQLERDLEERLEAIGREPGTPVDRIRAICRSIYSMLDGREPEVRLLYAIYYGPPQGTPDVDIEALPQRIEKALGEAVRAGMAEGSIRKGDLRITTLALQGALITAVECHIAKQQAPLGPAGLDRLLDVILRGVATPAPPAAPRKKKKDAR
jgi:TetR/AcrR family transcriptional regulator